MKKILLVLALVLTLIPPARAAFETELAAVLSPDPAQSQQAVTALRAAGPPGLQAALAYYDQLPASSPARATLAPAIDTIAAQHNALASRLYWYTDLEQAKARAASDKKPILYLRLLGKLTDEYSCANSRFFRTVLYANENVSKALRQSWVLIWVSERPVPVVTIDFGDGRILKRTLTGNSIHYILDPQGDVVDAIPGLCGAEAFLKNIQNPGWLIHSNLLWQGEAESTSKTAIDRYEPYRKRTEDRLLREWKTVAAAAVPELLAEANAAPDAAAAAPGAFGKAIVEVPLLRKISPKFAEALAQSAASADNAVWQKVAAAKIAESRLDANAIALIKNQNPELARDPASLAKTIEQFEQAVAVDTARNNFQFRPKILAYISQSKGTIKIEDLNQRVYSELFLTPRCDPWLGLAPHFTYSALTNDGRATR